MRQQALAAGIPFSTFKRMKVAEGTYAPNQGGKGDKSGRKYSVQDYLSGERFITCHRLKLRLFEEGLKEKKCEKCDLTEWLGVEIVLELDHKDRNPRNNMLSNLQVLCPNCHSLKTRLDRRKSWKDGRVVDGTALEKRKV